MLFHRIPVAIRSNRAALKSMYSTTQTSSTTGILGMEVYFPRNFVEQSDLEAHDKVGQGKYTIGLGQQRMAFVDTEREDAVSMILSATHNLIEKYGIDPTQIGRLEVGTESPIDKSKSIKSYLISVLNKSNFGNNAIDIEGIDTIHACYGGTSALLNAMYWLEANKTNPYMKDKYALVVCGDVSTYKEKAARPSGGAGAVAMLLGHGAPIRIDLQKKASHMDHVYDFYKPDPVSPYPVVDGHYSNMCYLESLDKCYQGFKQRSGLNVGKLDYLLFHSPYNKLVQKSLGRLVYNDFLEEKKAPSYLNAEKANAALTPEKVEQFLKLSTEQSYNDNELAKVFATISSDVYKQKTDITALLSKELGNCYTASLYISLASLVNNRGSHLDQKNIALFSYGSGSASTMFLANGVANNQNQHGGKFTLENMQKVLNLEHRLNHRIKSSIENYEHILAHNLARYGKHHYHSTSPINYLEKGTYYLESIDDKWRRVYLRK